MNEAAETTKQPPRSEDRFSNLEGLRLSQDYASAVGVKKVLATVRCQKPNRQEFVRVREGEDWRLETAIFEDKINRDIYMVAPELWTDMAEEINPVCLFTAITKQGDLFLWPVKLPGVDGRSNIWNESALKAAEVAQHKWIRMAANLRAGYYDLFEASGELAEPEWPEPTFPEILRLCFGDRFLESPDHPVLQELRGER